MKIANTRCRLPHGLRRYLKLAWRPCKTPLHGEVELRRQFASRTAPRPTHYSAQPGTAPEWGHAAQSGRSLAMNPIDILGQNCHMPRRPSGDFRHLPLAGNSQDQWATDYLTMGTPLLLVRLRRILAVLAALWLVVASPAMAAGAKVALIIGNSTYAGGNLPNPQNDARLVAQAARAAGFEVTLLADQGRVGFQMALREFRARADTAEVALVYYAGHGIDNNGENWLIPTDVTLADPRDLQFEAIPLSQVLDTVAGAKLRIILLDACRNSPFADKWTSLTRTIQRGLSRLDASEGSLVLFAADPGATVLDDGAGGNSHFAKAVAARLPEPGLPLQKLGNVVYDDVRLASGGVQRPYPMQRLSGVDYFLVPKPDDPGLGDESAFLRAQREGTSKAYGEYLTSFPNGKWRQEATFLILRHPVGKNNCSRGRGLPLARQTRRRSLHLRPRRRSS